MGQKTHPFGFRVGITKNWNSRWLNMKEYPILLKEDEKIRTYITSKIEQIVKASDKKDETSGISKIVIERKSKKVKVIIFSSKPGIIIGQKGETVDNLKEELKMVTAKDVDININEIENSAIDAQLIAENIARQIEKRVAYKRAMKRSVQNAMRLGARGIKIACGGRLNGAEIARTEWYREGRVPLQTLRADIDYGFRVARTTAGAIGVKVWVYNGEHTNKGIQTDETNIKVKKKK
ncbi:MAG: 30S ribosomal protein S3 [bacterium]